MDFLWNKIPELLSTARDFKLFVSSFQFSRIVKGSYAWKIGLLEEFNPQYSLTSNNLRPECLVGLGVSESNSWSWGRGFDSCYFHNFKCGSGLERGPFSLVRTIG